MGAKEENRATVVIRSGSDRGLQASKLHVAVEGVKTVMVEADANKLTISAAPEKTKKKSDDKKVQWHRRLFSLNKKKQTLMTTLVLKVAVQCEGCMKNMVRDTLLKMKGGFVVFTLSNSQLPDYVVVNFDDAINGNGIAEVRGISIDKERGTVSVTVKGTLDGKALVENLTEKLHTKDEVVKNKEGGSKKDGGNGCEKKKKGVRVTCFCCVRL